MIDKVTAQSETRAKKLAIIIVVVIITGLILALGNLGFTAASANIRVELSYNVTLVGLYAKEHEYLFRVFGWVYNYGAEDANVTVHIWMTDGTKSGGGQGSNICEFWQSYYIYLGEIPKDGGRKWLDWRRKCIPFDPTTACFSYELFPGGPNPPRNMSVIN